MEARSAEEANKVAMDRMDFETDLSGNRLMFDYSIDWSPARLDEDGWHSVES